MEFINYDDVARGGKRYDNFLAIHLDTYFDDFKKAEKDADGLPQLFIVIDKVPVGYFLLNSIASTSEFWFAHNFDTYPMSAKRDFLFDSAIAECEKYNATKQIASLREEKEDSSWDALRDRAREMAERNTRVNKTILLIIPGSIIVSIVTYFLITLNFEFGFGDRGVQYYCFLDLIKAGLVCANIFVTTAVSLFFAAMWEKSNRASILPKRS